ncbi:DUF58 domain-containing protein [Paenibacillus macerans]|uniref:DUF58 domain-containing protein n=1 Tax=Paenibacillus macerans TaxID=44252 RepID=UPI003D319E39
MRGGGWTWAAAIAAAGVLGVWYFWRGGASALFLLLLIALVMIQGAVVQGFGPRRIQVVRAWQPGYPVAGEEVAVTLTVRCAGGLPSFWMRVEDELAAIGGGQGTGRPGDKGGGLFFAGFRKEYHGTYTIKALDRGVYKGTAVRLTWGDPFGWFKRSRLVETEELLVVHPVPLAAPPPESEERGEQDGGGVILPKLVASSPAPGRLRPYEPGEPLRRIHWKYSAKKGMLLSRIPEEQGIMPRYLLLSARKEDYVSFGNGGEVPAASKAGAEPRPQVGAVSRFELAVSAAATWLQREAGESGDLMFSHGAMEGSCRTSGYEGLYDGLEQLSGLRFGTGLSAEALLRRDWSRLSAQGQSLTVITGRLTPGLTGSVLHLAELGVAAEVWCASGLSGPDQPELLAARLRERGVAVIDLSAYRREIRRKEGSGHASA